MIETRNVFTICMKIGKFRFKLFSFEFIGRLLKVPEMNKKWEVLSCLKPKSDLLKGFIDQNTTVPEDVLPSKSQGLSPVLKE